MSFSGRCLIHPLDPCLRQAEAKSPCRPWPSSLLKRLARQDLTGHGFRSTFRDWVAETTDFPHELAEMALGHTVGDAVEAAYRRGDMFERCRLLMHQWSEFVAASEKK